MPRVLMEKDIILESIWDLKLYILSCYACLYYVPILHMYYCIFMLPNRYLQMKSQLKSNWVTVAH